MGDTSSFCMQQCRNMNEFHYWMHALFGDRTQNTVNWMYAKEHKAIPQIRRQ